MFFAKSHEWVDERGFIGISQYAQEELGEIVYVELPPLGKAIRAGEPVCVLESTKAAADVYAPVSGEIIAVNEALRKNPSLINRAAEKEGWLYQIRSADAKELKQLLDLKQYQKLIGR